MKPRTRALAVSLILHSPLVVPVIVQNNSVLRSGWEGAKGLYEDAKKEYRAYQFRKAREKLVERARRDIGSGKYNLGLFVLQANHIDAEEEGKPFDFAGARGRYLNLLRSLSIAVRKGQSMKDAVPAVLGGMAYFGRPGGRMADALFQNGGSCAQLSVLIAALVHDIGYTKDIFLRAYGANDAGLSHIAPIFMKNGKEYDLLAGDYALRKGCITPAESLVEAYAAAHGLPAKTPQSSCASGSEDASGQKSESVSNPPLPSEPTGFLLPEADSYPGGVPVFMEQGVAKFSPGRSANSLRESPGPVSRPKTLAELDVAMTTLIIYDNMGITAGDTTFNTTIVDLDPRSGSTPPSSLKGAVEAA